MRNGLKGTYVPADHATVAGQVGGSLKFRLKLWRRNALGRLGAGMDGCWQGGAIGALESLLEDRADLLGLQQKGVVSCD
jgi:hypothetical protein